MFSGIEIDSDFETSIYAKPDKQMKLYQYKKPGTSPKNTGLFCLWNQSPGSVSESKYFGKTVIFV